RVVLETSVLRWVVRRGYDDAVSKMFFTAAVVHQNCARDYGGRSYAVVFLNDCLYVVRRQHFECGALCRPGKRVGIFSPVARPVSSLLATVVTDGLRDGPDVRFGECSVQ